MVCWAKGLCSWGVHRGMGEEVRIGREEGFNIIFNENGEPILRQGEKMITSAEGYFDPIFRGDLKMVLAGRIYLTSSRIIFIGSTSWVGALPDQGFNLLTVAVSTIENISYITEEKERRYYRYAEIRREEIKKVKWTLTREIAVQLDWTPVKFTSKDMEFKEAFFDECNRMRCLSE